MAIIDNTDIQSFYMNPSAYDQVKTEVKIKKDREVRRAGKDDFKRVLDDLRAKTADELGPFRELPVSEEAVNYLMDEVRSCGDTLRDRPFPEEIIRYKRAVRNFMHYVTENSYAIDHDIGIPRFLKPGYRGPRGTPESQKKARYTKIQVIDKKLEDLAARLLTDQKNKLKLAASLEEIRGLLIDLLQ